MIVILALSTHLKVLEAKDVQDADGLEVLFASDAAVECADDPVEALRVKCHCHGITGVDGLQHHVKKRIRTSHPDTVSDWSSLTRVESRNPPLPPSGPVTHLLHGERCGDLLAPEDHGAVGQDLRQLLRVQPQEVGGPAESCPNTNTQQTVERQWRAERRWWNAAGSSFVATRGEE